MSGTIRTRSTRRSRHRWWRVAHRTAAFSAMLFLIAEVAMVAVGTVHPSRAQAAQAPPGAGFNVTAGDLSFILKQIHISEHHAAAQTVRPSPTHPAVGPCEGLVGPGRDQVPDRLTPYGLRTVGGECNNLFPAGDVGNRPFFAASDQLFPRLAKPAVFRDADQVPAGFPLNQLSPGTPAPPARTSYKQKKGDVVDAQPRVISNLVVDQTSENPAALAAAGLPVRSQDPSPSAFPCDPGGDPSASDPDGTPNGCTMAHKTLFIPNVTTDVGLSPPYNSVFTFFGQFFDHGVDQTVKSGATVLVPLKDDDPLVTLGPDGIAGNGDEVPPSQRFMVLTRAKNQPGPDGALGTADDVRDATNTDSPWVDQSQTYTSHSSHQVFLRQYALNGGGRTVATGKLLGGLPGNGASGMATWALVKKQAADLLGLKLADKDVLNVPMLAADPYGNFIPGPHGLPQYVTKSHGLIEGDRSAPVAVPSDVRHFDTP